MQDDEFQNYADEAMAWLSAKQEALKHEYCIEAFEDYFYDGELEVLQFKNDGVVQLEFPYVDIASWHEKGSFLWAWDNPSNTQQMRQKASTLKELEQVTGQSIFGTAHLECDIYLAWELAAIAARHLGAIGVYRAPSNQLFIFMAIMPQKDVL